MLNEFQWNLNHTSPSCQIPYSTSSIACLKWNIKNTTQTVKFLHIHCLWNQKNKSRKAQLETPSTSPPPIWKAQKEITWSVYPVNFTQKFRLPTTDVYLHPENQGHISSNLICWEHTLTCAFQTACSFIDVYLLTKKTKPDIKPAKRY